MSQPYRRSHEHVRCAVLARAPLRRLAAIEPLQQELAVLA
eukprot:CAMPEP_0118939024 /NCGR_PEP_ID=MMETSP1169-20130426/27744_1 /TAXON_ID=36882 /ORGANISM="Pyramimonas obovata, Strain CCMP722" /LENGTH=39 /DNA_ID= /DNA_START= /DNA_END= /DNA_ORIENTATION=